MGGQRRQLFRAEVVDGVRNIGVATSWDKVRSRYIQEHQKIKKDLHGDTVGRGLAGNETVPSFGAFTDDVHGISSNASLATYCLTNTSNGIY